MSVGPIGSVTDITSLSDSGALGRNVVQWASYQCLNDAFNQGPELSGDSWCIAGCQADPIGVIQWDCQVGLCGEVSILMNGIKKSIFSNSWEILV